MTRKNDKKTKKDPLTNVKLSDQEFWGALRNAFGNYGRAVKVIKAKFGVDITRQSVRERALKKPELLADIKEQLIDFAEENLVSIARNPETKPSTRLRANETILKALGRNRGWGDKMDVDVKSGGQSLSEILRDVGERFNPQEKEK